MRRRNIVTVHLESDITLEGPVTLPDNATVTILYSGHHIRNTDDIILQANTKVIADVITNQFVAGEGYVINWTKNDDSTWIYELAPSTWPVTITKADGETKSYETAAAAFNASRDGDTVTLNEDIEVAISLYPTDTSGVSSGNVLVDLNGHTAAKGASSVGGTTMTLINGTITNTASSATKGVSAYGGNGTVIVENSVNVEAGIAVHSSPGYNDTTAVAIINGGNFVGTSQAIKIEKAGGSSRTNGGKVIVNGGTFTGPITVAAGGELVITGGKFNTDPSAYVAEGYAAIEQDGVWNVVPANG